MNKNELLTKDIKTLIKQIAIPSSIGMFFSTMYNVVDTFYIGTISTIAITALSYSFVLFFMVLSIAFGLSSAITAHVGNSLGRHKHFLAKVFVINGITFVTLVSLVLCAIGFIFLEDVMRMIGASGDSLQMALQYTYIILLGVTPLLLGLVANASLIAKGDTKSYRNILIVGFVLNLILDPLFIYGFWLFPAFGFKGVAYATVLIQFITCIYILIKLNETNLLSFKTKKLFLPDMRIYKKILKQAIPMSINMLTMSIGTMIVMNYVSQYGYKTVAAFGIGYRVEQIILLPMLGLNTAVSSIVANNFGAKNYNRIHEVIKKSLKYGFVMGFIGILFLYLFGEYIIMFFDKDPIVVSISYEYVLIESFIFFAFITIFISNSTLQGIKKPNAIAYVSLYRQILMPYLCLYAIVNIYHLDIVYVWITMGVIIYSASFGIYFYMKHMLKKHMIVEV